MTISKSSFSLATKKHPSLRKNRPQLNLTCNRVRRSAKSSKSKTGRGVQLPWCRRSSPWTKHLTSSQRGSVSKQSATVSSNLIMGDLLQAWKNLIVRVAHLTKTTWALTSTMSSHTMATLTWVTKDVQSWKRSVVKSITGRKKCVSLHLQRRILAIAMTWESQAMIHRPTIKQSTLGRLRRENKVSNLAITLRPKLALICQQVPKKHSMEVLRKSWVKSSQDPDSEKSENWSKLRWNTLAFLHSLMYKSWICCLDRASVVWDPVCYVKCFKLSFLSCSTLF